MVDTGLQDKEILWEVVGEVQSLDDRLVKGGKNEVDIRFLFYYYFEYSSKSD